MYKILTVISLLFLGCPSFSQALEASLSAQKTVIGTHKGIGLKYNIKNNWALGLIYQAYELPNQERSGSSQNLKAIVLQMPIKKCEEINVLFQVQIGHIDDQFMVILPAVETQFKVLQHLWAGLNMSYRYGHPAIGARCIFKLKK